MVKLDHSEFVRCRFTKSKIVGVDWTKASWKRTSLLQQSEIGFEECSINYSTFIGLDLTGMKMVDCLANEVDFSETNLQNAVFNRTNFSNSRFSNTNLTEADFTNAIHYDIDIKNNLVKNARFSMLEAISLLKSLDVIIED